MLNATFSVNATFFHWYLPLCLSEKNAHRPKNRDFSDSSSVLYILSSWFHLLVENCKMMVACPHHPGFLSHNVPITITRLSSRNKSSSENQRWKWNVRKFSQNGLTKTNEKKVATCYLATLVKKNVKLESLKWWCSFFYWHFERRI